MIWELIRRINNQNHWPHSYIAIEQLILWRKIWNFLNGPGSTATKCNGHLEKLMVICVNLSLLIVRHFRADMTVRMPDGRTDAKMQCQFFSCHLRFYRCRNNSGRQRYRQSNYSVHSPRSKSAEQLLSKLIKAFTAIAQCAQG